MSSNSNHCITGSIEVSQAFFKETEATHASLGQAFRPAILCRLGFVIDIPTNSFSSSSSRIMAKRIVSNKIGIINELSLEEFVKVRPTTIQSRLNPCDM